MVFAMFGISVPNFWLGLLMIIFFAVWLGWLPTGGYIAFTADPVGWLRTSTMPAISLALLQVGLLARITRSTMLEVLRQDYIRTARAKGLPRRLVVVKHALANALIPITTVVGIIISLLDFRRGGDGNAVLHPRRRTVADAGGAQPRLSARAGRAADGHRAAGAGECRWSTSAMRCSIRGCAMNPHEAVLDFEIDEAEARGRTSARRRSPRCDTLAPAAAAPVVCFAACACSASSCWRPRSRR